MPLTHSCSLQRPSRSSASDQRLARSKSGESGHFLGFGVVFGNRTLFENVSLLPAGSCWAVNRPSAIKKRTYFQPSEWTEQPPVAPEHFYASLRSAVSAIVPAYFRAAAPVGLSLTGGLDTRIVMAGMPPGSGPMPSYTYTGVYRDCYDIGIARDIATTCGQRHHVLGLGQDFFRNFDTLADQTVWVTDGCLDLCGAHEIYFSKLARELSPIRLTGNYGSEVLRSVSTFKYHAPRPGLFDAPAVDHTVRAQRAFVETRAAHPVTFAAFQEIPWNCTAGWQLRSRSLRCAPVHGQCARVVDVSGAAADARDERHLAASDCGYEPAAGDDSHRYGIWRECVAPAGSPCGGCTDTHSSKASGIQHRHAAMVGEVRSGRFRSG